MRSVFSGAKKAFRRLSRLERCRFITRGQSLPEAVPPELNVRPGFIRAAVINRARKREIRARTAAIFITSNGRARLNLHDLCAFETRLYDLPFLFRN